MAAWHYICKLEMAIWRRRGGVASMQKGRQHLRRMKWGGEVAGANVGRSALEEAEENGGRSGGVGRRNIGGAEGE